MIDHWLGLGLAASKLPTSAFMAASTKPRLRRWHGKWECLGQGGSALGETPWDAYMSWSRLFQNSVRGQS